jgi:hypothetical protein
MSASVVSTGAHDPEHGVITPRLLSVKRDRDNVVLVGDERLVVPFLADALGVDDNEAASALHRLCDVLPAATKRLGLIGVPALARLCADLPGLSRRLIELESSFPNCDVASMCVQSPWLLEESCDAVIRPSLEELREIFPEAGSDGKPDVDRMVRAVPQLLDASFAAAAVAALAASLGISKNQAATKIHANPRLALEVESAKIRSRYSTSFDQGHVKGNRVVEWDGRKEREPYYSRSAAPALQTPAKKTQ